MALSLLQDAQTRGLAAALAGMKREEERSLTMSPPMVNSTSPVYPGLHSAAAASALGMLSPSILAANRTAAALMAARLPMSTLASVSSLFPHHPALFGTWHQPPSISSTGPHSPPASPISPVMNAKKLAHNNNSINNNNNNTLNSNNNNLVSTTIDIPTKKPRKISVKKDLISPPIEIPNNHDVFTSGPISPPSSGSSPNSNTEGPAIHGNSKDPSRDKCFTCKICNRSFGYKHVLQNHERTHTGEKPFECPECHKRFTRDHHLKTHMRLHTGEKPYHCSHCDRQFVQVANLRRHLRVHTGERPYSCEVCEARFSDSNQLKSHVLIHNGEKPFECDRCHLKFRRRHHLMHHKCGIQSPPTPAISPAISDVGMSDQKSAISSFAGSDESNDLIHKTSSTIMLSQTSSASTAPGTPLSSTISSTTRTTQQSISRLTVPQFDHQHHHPHHHQHHHNQHSTSFDVPLDLSEDGQINIATPSSTDNEKRSRKSTDIRRVLRLPQQILHIPTELPEQTEPEDLSMHSPRSRTSLHSPISLHHDLDDLEDLDEAATLYMKQRNHKIIEHIEQQQHQHQQQQHQHQQQQHHRKRHFIDRHTKS